MTGRSGPPNLGYIRRKLQLTVSDTGTETNVETLPRSQLGRGR
jgi:hypothetical protein